MPGLERELLILRTKWSLGMCREGRSSLARFSRGGREVHSRQTVSEASPRAPEDKVVLGTKSGLGSFKQGPLFDPRPRYEVPSAPQTLPLPSPPPAALMDQPQSPPGPANRFLPVASRPPCAQPLQSGDALPARSRLYPHPTPVTS